MGEVNSLCVSNGEVIGDLKPSWAVARARGLLILSGDDGCGIGIRDGDSWRWGDLVPGSIMLRRFLWRELAARLKSPNSDAGDSVRGGRDIRDEDLALPSLSLLSLSKNNEPRRE